MKLKRSIDFLTEKKKSHPGIGSFDSKRKKQINDRSQLEILRKKIELEKEKKSNREETKDDREEKEEKKSGRKSVIKKFGELLGNGAKKLAKELTKTYEPSGRYY